jgi:hypothetical protein
MRAVEFIFYISSILILGAAFWDAFITVFSSSGAGPLTRFWTRRVWRGLLWVHRKRPIHRPLALAGPLMLLANIVIWYALIGAGFYSVYVAHPDSVVENTTRERANRIKKIYFVGTTISSLGYGDLVPSRFPWTVISSLSSFLGAVVLTVSLSYVLPVLAAAIDRQTLAQSIFGLGRTVPALIQRTGLGGPKGPLETYLLSLASAIDQYAHKHLAYPVLHFFHPSSADRSPARAILMLSDAFFVLRALEHRYRPPREVLQLVENSISNYAELASFGIKLPSSSEPHPGDLVETVRELGLREEEDAGFRQALKEYMPRRRLLLALCREDGWCENEHGS